MKLIGVVEPTRTGYREVKADPEDIRLALAIHQAKLNRTRQAMLRRDIGRILREAARP